MNLYALFPLTAILANVILGCYIIYRDPKSTLNRVYSLFVFSLAIWALGDFFTFTSMLPEVALFWVMHVTITGASLTPAFLLHFFSLFTKTKFVLRKVNVVSLYLPALFFIFVSYTTDLITKSVQLAYWGYKSVYGIIYYPYTLYAITYIIIGLVLCYRFHSKTKQSREKKQAKFLMIAILIPLVGGIMTQIILPFIAFEIVPLSTMLTTLTAVIIAYSMIKYGLMEPLSFSIRNRITATFLLLTVLLMILSVSLAVSLSAEAVKSQSEKNLLTTANMKVKWIESYISDRKKDITVITNSPSVRNLLDEKLTMDAEAAKENIKQIAFDVAKQIEEYIKSHPDMTIKDLQNDSYFQSIAVQKVGQTGYTALTDYNTLTCRFHANPAIVDVDLHILAEKLPGFWSVMSFTEGGADSDGFYDWEEADGSMREKYMYIHVINTTTSDGIGLHVAATTYLDEYKSSMKITQDYEKYLRQFVEKYGYYDLLLVDSTGTVWWSGKNADELGTNLYTEPNMYTEMANVFINSKESGKVEFSDYEIHVHTSEPVMFLGLPVYNNDNFLGAVILQIDTDQISEIMEDSTGLGETGETYIVNNDYLMLTNSRFSDENLILRQTVDTLITRNCLEMHHQTGVYEGQEEITLIKDYRDISVLSTHIYMPEMGWCMISEIDEAEVYSDTYILQNTMIQVFIAFTIVGIVISFIVGRSISNPIIKLRNAAKEIGKGKLDTKIEITPGDEIGELASAFNQMTKDLKKSKRETKRYMTGLEHEVRKRTKDLQNKVHELTDTKAAVLNMMEDMDEANMELVQTQDELKGTLQELKNTDVKKDQFISIAAHELKTPLTSIHGFSQLLQDRKISNNFTKRRKYLKIMDHETKRLGKLVSNILDLSRIDLGTVRTDLTTVELNSFISNIQKEMEIHIVGKKLKSEYDVEKRLPKILTDGEKLSEIFINLINNAVKYTEKGKITVKAFVEDGHVHCIVKDTGIGIPKDQHEKIFDRFYQIDSTYTRKVGGTGLGLALCKEFVELLGGRIWAKSEVGKGSQFHFTLPFKSTSNEYVRKTENVARENLKKAEKMQKTLKKLGFGK